MLAPYAALTPAVPAQSEIGALFDSLPRKLTRVERSSSEDWHLGFRGRGPGSRRRQVLEVRDARLPARAVLQAIRQAKRAQVQPLQRVRSAARAPAREGAL